MKQMPYQAMPIRTQSQLGGDQLGCSSGAQLRHRGSARRPSAAAATAQISSAIAQFIARPPLSFELPLPSGCLQVVQGPDEAGSGCFQACEGLNPHQCPPRISISSTARASNFRAFHVLPGLTNKFGLNVGAVYGYTTMLWKLADSLNKEDGPTHLAVILDASESNFRNQMYDQYRANRPPPPPELVPQFPLIRDATRAFSIPCIEENGLEADDIIACFAMAAREQDWSVTIVSSDKDLMQLIEPGVDMLDTMRDRRIGRTRWSRSSAFPGPAGRCARADGRQRRQRPRRPRHRAQDRLEADPGIWRPPDRCSPPPGR